MSYILDALKKAERERGISQVPTLSTVHDLREKRPVRLWAASGIAVLCIGVFVLVYFLRSDAGDAVSSSMTESSGSLASPSEPEQLQAEAPVNDAPVSAPPARPPATPALAEQEGIERTVGAGREPIEREREEVQSNLPAAVPLLDEAVSESPVQVQAEIPAHDPSPVTEAEGAISLRDALEKMTVSILLYSENESDRLVFINGRKYVEGDMVEGNYLLESITPDGAVLSNGTERATLRPDRN